MCFAWVASKGSADTLYHRDAVAKPLKSEKLALSQLMGGPMDRKEFDI